MDRKERDEYLEAIWYLSENDPPCISSLKQHAQREFTDAVIGELAAAGLIREESGGEVKLTESGYQQARQIVRCHRLAERLLADVLGMPPRETEKGACDFEHVIVAEIADSICTLLGHPSECPHGLKIPEGACCRASRATLQSAIVPLDKVALGKPVRVSYVKTASNSRMHKLSHFGIIPGAEISIHQRYPSFIIECGNTQVAMEEDVAREVFVFDPGGQAVDTPVPKRRRWRLGRRQ